MIERERKREKKKQRKRNIRGKMGKITKRERKGKR